MPSPPKAQGASNRALGLIRIKAAASPCGAEWAWTGDSQ